MMFVTMADVKINLVPYRGTAPAVADTIAGHVQLGIADPPPSMGAISEGKLKALAVTSKKRFPVFPDVPTFDEQGLKDFDVTGWFGIAAPAATPPAIVTKLNEAVVAALNDPEVARRIRTIGMEPTPMTPEQFSAFLDSEIAKAAKVQPAGGTSRTERAPRQSAQPLTSHQTPKSRRGSLRGGFENSFIVSRLISVLGRPGSDLLFQALRLSTIGAGEFNGRVRDGIGYRLPAIPPGRRRTDVKQARAKRASRT